MPSYHGAMIGDLSSALQPSGLCRMPSVSVKVTDGFFFIRISQKGIQGPMEGGYPTLSGEGMTSRNCTQTSCLAVCFVHQVQGHCLSGCLSLFPLQSKRSSQNAALTKVILFHVLTEPNISSSKRLYKI